MAGATFAGDVGGCGRCGDAGSDTCASATSRDLRFMSHNWHEPEMRGDGGDRFDGLGRTRFVNSLRRADRVKEASVAVRSAVDHLLRRHERVAIASSEENTHHGQDSVKPAPSGALSAASVVSEARLRLLLVLTITPHRALEKSFQKSRETIHCYAKRYNHDLHLNILAEDAYPEVPWSIARWRSLLDRGLLKGANVCTGGDAENATVDWLVHLDGDTVFLSSQSEPSSSTFSDDTAEDPMRQFISDGVGQAAHNGGGAPEVHLQLRADTHEVVAGAVLLKLRSAFAFAFVRRLAAASPFESSDFVLRSDATKEFDRNVYQKSSTELGDGDTAITHMLLDVVNPSLGLACREAAFSSGDGDSGGDGGGGGRTRQKARRRRRSLSQLSSLERLRACWSRVLPRFANAGPPLPVRLWPPETGFVQASELQSSRVAELRTSCQSAALFALIGAKVLRRWALRPVSHANFCGFPRDLVAGDVLATDTGLEPSDGIIVGSDVSWRSWVAAKVVFVVPTLARATGVSYLADAVDSIRRFARGLAVSVLLFADPTDATALQVEEGSWWTRIPLLRLARSPRPHPRLQQPLTRNFNDSLERVRWRTQLVLDFVEGMSAAISEPGKITADMSSSSDAIEHGREPASDIHGVMWFEDDVAITDMSWAPRVSRILLGPPDEWFAVVSLGFRPDPDRRTWLWANQGYGGKGCMIFNSRYLQQFLVFARLRCDVAPLDWLVDIFLREVRPDLRLVRLDPPGLKHLGEHSTWGDPAWATSRAESEGR
eukprot:TRINITY_DN5545_c0_g1_i2.p1 TRINITY_DN5545_c0_g1~~TRINITY_DN5545_c0_g1_i2.p1  ORF type:complete len:773 (+),score=99.51 TRINITY_DN5545_c0_g1_i2:95-2413(+)